MTECVDIRERTIIVARPRDPDRDAEREDALPLLSFRNGHHGGLELEASALAMSEAQLALASPR